MGLLRLNLHIRLGTNHNHSKFLFIHNQKHLNVYSVGWNWFKIKSINCSLKKSCNFDESFVDVIYIFSIEEERQKYKQGNHGAWKCTLTVALFFLLDARTFCWQFIAMSRISEIRVTFKSYLKGTGANCIERKKNTSRSVIVYFWLWLIPLSLT